MPRPKRELSDPTRPGKVTLQQIADVAGLNVMTVSKALNDAPIVALKTRERIKRIAQELNYVPNSAARALVTGRTGIIAIMSGPMNEPYYAGMVHCLENILNAENYRLLLTPYAVEQLIDATGNTAVDGAIAIDRHDLIEQFQIYAPVPCVSIGTIERHYIDHILVDLSTGVEAALEIMLKGNRQRIAYLVTSFALAERAEVRAATYFKSMERAGRTPEVIDVSTNTLSEVELRLKNYILENGCPDALLCQNDETAMCAYRVLKDLKHRIPEDVLLVGCDGQLHMKYFDPPLSTIVQPMEAVCATAWQFLKNRMANPTLPLQHAIIPGELLIRQSLAIPSEATP